MLTRYMFVMLVMVLTRAFMLRFVDIDEVAGVAMFVRVYMKHADQEKHCDQAAQRPSGDTIDRSKMCQRVRQQMQESHAEHYAADKTHRQLHAAGGQLDPSWQHAAGD